MVLMHLIDLDQIHKEHSLGVPVAKLIAKYGIELTDPTVTKLIKYYDALFKAADAEVKETITNSLNPQWLKDQSYKYFEVHYQPYEWYYSGRMPLGEWRMR